MKETLREAEARGIVRETREALFTKLREHGVSLEVGQVDGDGKPITEEYLRELSEGVDSALWGELRDNLTILEEDR